MFVRIPSARILLGLYVFCIYCPQLAAQDSVFSKIRKSNSIAPLTRISLSSPEVGKTESPKDRSKQAKGSFGLPDLTDFRSSQYFPQAGSQRTMGGSCPDSSFLKIFEAQERAYSFFTSAKTKDGGIVLGGYGRNKLLGPPYIWYGVVTKFDSIGRHLWSKELRSDAIPPGMYIEGISELSDGSILVSGWHSNPLSSSPPTPTVDFFAAKLTSSGDLVWLKTFHSLMGNGCTTSNIRYVWPAEGANGDLYLAGTIPNCPDPRYVVVFKLNSAGDLLWKYNFTGHFSQSYTAGIFYDGNSVTVVSLGAGSIQYGVSVDLVRLDAATGTYLSHKSWEPDLAFPENFYASMVNWTPTVVRLTNGNYCVYGNTFGDFYNPLNANLPHFSVLEFNSNYDFVKGYTINSPLAPNGYESKIKVDRFGKVIYSMSEQLSYPDEMKYYGIADNGNILNQRKRSQNGLEVFYDNAELFDNGSVVYINNLATQGQSNFYLYYTLMHVTDTGGQCLGTLDNFSTTAPVSYKLNSVAWTAPNPNPLISTSNQNNSVVPIDYTESPPCYEKSYCDTIKIHGNATSCDLQQDLNFTVFKNVQCGARVNWSVDTAVVQSFRIINDTSLAVRFKQAWKGWLYAKMQTSCGELVDSVLITVLRPAAPVNIGPDTSICQATTIMLNAHRGYATYLWNSGVTDSLIAVSLPGKYYVDVTDSCGNSFSDTVMVSLASAVPISIGPDRTKCNADTIRLQAPPGFMNYTWSPNYNINTINGQQVIVEPTIDTVYTLIAEKTPGCFGYDTVRVTVHNSPSINLGPDKSFCAGDSLVLDAGTGFTQYQWSNGSNTQKSITYTAGIYSVIGITAQGCRSFDTLAVLNVYMLPVVSLNKDSVLCNGDQKILDAGSGFINYSWNTGAGSRTIMVNNVGVFSVTVTDNNGCKGADTTKITSILPGPSSFLGPDTSICSYGELQLKPNGTFNQYLWSNGSSASSILVKQPGLYWLQVRDANGCMGKDSIAVGLRDCGDGFFMPTAFTPNSDGKNDLLKPILLGNVIQYKFWIYNRWGELIFESADVAKGWDGLYKGQLQSSGVFVWRCLYQFKDGPVKNVQGTAVLIR